MVNDMAPVDSVQAFLERIEQLSASWYPVNPGQPWFRGTANPLQPGAVWAGLWDEESAYNEFVVRAGGMLVREPADEWEWYFLLQHYGMATRLLDWTTNPFVAMYFALQAAAEATAPTSVRVWMLDPAKLNAASVGLETVFTPGGELTQHWLPSRLSCDSPDHFAFNGRPGITNQRPLAIYPKRRNPRILAQSGTFTVHGTESTPVDACMERLERSDQKIARIEIDVIPSRASQLLQLLSSLGFSSSILFPEPAHLAREVRGKYATR